MKILIAFTFLLAFQNCFSQLSDQHIRDLKRGAVTNDTSYVYGLPYNAGEKYPFVQGGLPSFAFPTTECRWATDPTEISNKKRDSLLKTWSFV